MAGLLQMKRQPAVSVSQVTGSRAAGASVFLNEARITPEVWAKVRGLQGIAGARGQSLAQMAIAWVLRGGGITTALIGASKPSQVLDCVGAINNLAFSADELALIDQYADEEQINLWAASAELDS